MLISGSFIDESGDFDTQLLRDAYKLNEDYLESMKVVIERISNEMVITAWRKIIYY